MGLTVREHLVLAYRARVAPHRMWRDMLDPRALFRTSPGETEKVDGLLELLHLTHVAKAPVAALPLGVIRLVEVGRALASEPRVLLLDEPLSGPRPPRFGEPGHGLRGNRRAERRRALARHRGARRRRRAGPVGLGGGPRLRCSGSPSAPPKEVRSDPAVRTAYLGDVEPPTAHGAPGRRAATTASQMRRPEGGGGMTEPLLRVEGLDVSYGPSQALFGVSIDVAPGSVLAVLGVNGAGKSTFARAMSGLVPPTAGRVTFDGQDITRLPAHRIRRLGLTYIPEGRGIFPRPVGHRQPADGGRPGAALRSGRGHRAGHRAVPRAGQTPVPAGREPVGR